MPLFNRPTVLALTAPTCSGKNYLLEALFSHSAFNELRKSVSTTTRPTRPGEIDGVDYHFVSVSAFKRLIDQHKLIEHNLFLDNYYGLSQDALAKQVEDGVQPICILDINGLFALRTFCLKSNIGLFSVFVDTPLEIRLERLVERTLAELETGRPSMQLVRAKTILEMHTERVVSTAVHEERWRRDFELAQPWSAIIPGTDADMAIAILLDRIEQFNQLRKETQ